MPIGDVSTGLIDDDDGHDKTEIEICVRAVAWAWAWTCAWTWAYRGLIGFSFLSWFILLVGSPVQS